MPKPSLGQAGHARRHSPACDLIGCCGRRLSLPPVARHLVWRLLVGPEVVVYPVRHGDLIKTIVATGHVETPFLVNVASQITGTVSDVLVGEGEIVRQGQALVRLESSELNSNDRPGQRGLDADRSAALADAGAYPPGRARRSSSASDVGQC